MDWKKEAVEKLEQYSAKKLSLLSIPKEIRGVELSMQSIKSASSDGMPVQGGGCRREDMLLSNVVKKEELERMLERASLWVDSVDAALSVLDKDERTILEHFFVNQEKGAADRLAGELRMDVKTVYRRRDKALRRFTIALYGAEKN